MKDKIIPGRYRHYKGKQYQVIDIAIHSETEALHVVYRPLYGEGALWVRPIELFTDSVEVNGETRKRFELLEES